MTPQPVPRTVPLLNLANALTGLRIVLVPVFLGLTVASGMTSAHLRIHDPGTRMEEITTTARAGL